MSHFVQSLRELGYYSSSLNRLNYEGLPVSLPFEERETRSGAIMAKTRQEKEQILAQLQEDLQQRAVILADYQGLTVAEVTDLRDQLFETGYRMMVVKNTILGKALKDANLDLSEEALNQPLSVIVANDEVAVSKLVEKFAKDHDKITIIGGWIDGKFVDATYITTLSKLPGREELLAKLVGSINAPISGFVNVLAGNIRGLVSVIKQYAEQKSL